LLALDEVYLHTNDYNKPYPGIIIGFDLFIYFPMKLEGMAPR